MEYLALGFNILNSYRNVKEKEYIDVLNSFQKDLEIIEKVEFMDFSYIHKAIVLCRKTLSKLKKYTVLYEFDTIEEEIDFFKNYKSKVLKNLIYYSELRHIESQFPELSINSQRDYILLKEQKIKKFFKKFDFLMQYINLDLTNLDELFFTIKPIKETCSYELKPGYIDASFYTHHDFLIAKIKAYGKLLEYLKLKFRSIDDFMRYGKPMVNNKTLHWTGTKTQLTELIYALHAAKTINNGKTDIVEIQRELESIFNIKLNDIYKIYSEIKNRQKSQTKFLEEMIEGLMNEINKSYR
ncbi:RteC domain-containing protein [Aureibaculum sp. 2210JD6-5]|uniref:RteC domain-containing protein n=1 Tax=Aureibaculum sp. 2210JD6-5 TaxID=3103957 RepID=UPI002AACA9D5|nr:RteC domain-containing protein [Aureibaculum sp. 2210JD6-5]MDY7396864.1 RteC domain-containing protein [Aureibaculum sp. 2210JD6-5]